MSHTQRRRRKTFWSLSVAGALGAACSALPPTATPLPTTLYPAPSGDAHGLIVMLPGRGDRLGTYARHGFVELVHNTNPDFDVIETDAHIGYYYAGSLAARLHEDVIAPARERYRQIWLCGISMGGFGSASYVVDHPDTVDGMIVLAPWMGHAGVARDVRDADDLASWTPAAVPTGQMADVTLEERSIQVWSLLQQQARHPDDAPRLFLGYGEQDRFVENIAPIAAALPPERRHAIPGPHKWTVWQPLFAELVHRAIGDPVPAATPR